MKRIYFIYAMLLLVAAACNQKEPEESVDDYYPLTPGATWTYLHSSRGGWTEVVTVSEGTQPDEVLLSDTENPSGERSENTLLKSDTAVMRTAKRFFVNDAIVFTVDYDPGFVRFDAAWLEVSPPYTEERAYVRTETDVGQSPKTPRDRSHEYTVEALDETVEVEGSTFRNCVRVRRLATYLPTNVAPDAGTAAPTAQDMQGKLFWFAPGVGKVREQNLDNGNTEVLVDYEIPEL
jgi:hypothetical protein